MALPYLHQLLYRSGYLCHLYLKPPPLTWPALCHFTFIFQQNFFRVPISRKISFKCNKMQCRCHKSIPLDCRRRRRGGRRTSQRRKIEMHWHWKINNKRVAKVAQRASIFGIGIFIMYVYGKFCRFVNAEIKYFQKSKQNNKKPKKKIQKPSETPRNNFKTFSLTADPTRHSDTTATLTQTRGMAVPVCAWKYATHTASASQTSLVCAFRISFSLEKPVLGELII